MFIPVGKEPRFGDPPLPLPGPRSSGLSSKDLFVWVGWYRQPRSLFEWTRSPSPTVLRMFAIHCIQVRTWGGSSTRLPTVLPSRKEEPKPKQNLCLSSLYVQIQILIDSNSWTWSNKENRRERKGTWKTQPQWPVTLPETHHTLPCLSPHRSPCLRETWLPRLAEEPTCHRERRSDENKPRRPSYLRTSQKWNYLKRKTTETYREKWLPDTIIEIIKKSV